jgi:hypothetical protein
MKIEDHTKLGIAMALAVSIATLLVLSIQYWPVDGDKLGIVKPEPNQVRLHPTAPQSQIIQMDFATPNFDYKTVKKMTTLAIVGTVVKQSDGPNDGPIPQIANQIQVERVLKGQAKDTVTVMTPRTSKNVIIEDAYQLHNGDKGVFLLFKWKGSYQIVGNSQGKYQFNGNVVKGKFIPKGLDINLFIKNFLGASLPQPKDTSTKSELTQQHVLQPHNEKLPEQSNTLKEIQPKQQQTEPQQQQQLQSVDNNSTLH